jgi:gliding motility-associated lipoprotein GldD
MQYYCNLQAIHATMFQFKLIIFLLFFISIVFASCQYDDYTPKPRGYYRVELPAKKYTTFAEPGFPYHFDYPVYGVTAKDSLFFDKKPENPYWMNIEFANFGAKIYLTYKEIKNKNDLAVMIEDCYKMTNAHDKKADYIEDPTFHTANNVNGVFFEVAGNTATALQFFATDSVHHFLRGALYFNVTPNADSLKPANQFLRADVEHLIKTLKWIK